MVLSASHCSRAYGSSKDHHGVLPSEQIETKCFRAGLRITPQERFLISLPSGAKVPIYRIQYLGLSYEESQLVFWADTVPYSSALGHLGLRHPQKGFQISGPHIGGPHLKGRLITAHSEKYLHAFGLKRPLVSVTSCGQSPFLCTENICSLL